MFLCITYYITSLITLVWMLSPGSAFTDAPQQEKQDDRGLGKRQQAGGKSTSEQNKSGSDKPELVLQAGITVPQFRIRFSPDGRLLASMGIDGATIKLWETASGRLLRQVDVGVESILSSALSQPFTFSPDGRVLMVLAGKRIKRWEVDTGREIEGTALQGLADFLSAQMSEDGSVVLTPTADNQSVKFADTKTGRELASLTFDDEDQLVGRDSLVLSRDGKQVAMLVENTRLRRSRIEREWEIKIFETASGRKIQSWKLEPSALQLADPHVAVSIFFSGDGQGLGLSVPGTLLIWDLSAGRQVKSLSIPENAGKTFDENGINPTPAISPDSKLLSVVSEGMKVKLFDLNSATAKYTLVGHTGKIAALSFSDDGRFLASTGTDNMIKLWDAATGQEARTLSGSSLPVTDVAFSKDGRSLILGNSQGVNIWELSTGGMRRAIELPDDYNYNIFGEGRSGILNSDGSLLITASRRDPVAKVWDVATGKELRSLPLADGKEMANAVFSPDGRTLVLTDRKNAENRKRAMQQPTTQSPFPTQPAQQNTGTQQNQPQNQSQATPNTADMKKVLEQMRNGSKMKKEDMKKMQEAMKQQEEQMRKMEEAVKKGDMSAMNSVMSQASTMMSALGITLPTAAPTAPNSIRVIEAETGREMQKMPVTDTGLGMGFDSNRLYSSQLAFSPDGRLLATAAGDSPPIRLRDARTGQEIRSLKVPFSWTVASLAWSADSRRLASSHMLMDTRLASQVSSNVPISEMQKNVIKIWDSDTGSELATLEGHSNTVDAMAFSRDGRLLASGSDFEGTIKIWDVSTGTELRSLTGHSVGVSKLSFSPDNKFLISSSNDGSARIWNPDTGTLLATLIMLNKGEDWLVVTPDGLFDGSPAGWNEILWRFSQNTFDVSPVEIFFNEFYYPGLLPDILAGKKVSAEIDISQKDRRQPQLKIVFADGQSTTNVTARDLKLKINVTEAPAGAQDVRLFRNGSLVKLWRGDVLKGQSSTTLEAAIPIIAGSNQITAYAFNRDNVKSADARLSINGADSLKREGTLYIIAAGVNQYANSEYNLKYAVADASAFAEEVEHQQRRLGRYTKIERITLLDREATKANILLALRRLTDRAESQLPQGAPPALEKLKAAEPEDSVIVYFAGHGTAQEQRFYLIPHDLGYNGARDSLDETGLQTILSHSISDLELEQGFEEIDVSHLLMVIDACNSGQALEAEEKRRGPMNSKGLAQLAYEKGMYILTAAQSFQAALEAAQLGHGYLTYALVEEGLKSTSADRQPKDNQVVMREWLDYATERVPAMQEAKMKDARALKLNIAFVAGEEKIESLDQRSLQRPRVFYRREVEPQPMVVAKP